MVHVNSGLIMSADGDISGTGVEDDVDGALIDGGGEGVTGGFDVGEVWEVDGHGAGSGLGIELEGGGYGEEDGDAAGAGIDEGIVERRLLRADGDGPGAGIGGEPRQGTGDGDGAGAGIAREGPGETSGGNGAGAGISDEVALETIDDDVPGAGIGVNGALQTGSVDGSGPGIQDEFSGDAFDLDIAGTGIEIEVERWRTRYSDGGIGTVRAEEPEERAPGAGIEIETDLIFRLIEADIGPVKNFLSLGFTAGKDMEQDLDLEGSLNSRGDLDIGGFGVNGERLAGLDGERFRDFADKGIGMDDTGVKENQGDAGHRRKEESSYVHHN